MHNLLISGAKCRIIIGKIEFQLAPTFAALIPARRFMILDGF